MPALLFAISSSQLLRLTRISSPKAREERERTVPRALGERWVPVEPFPEEPSNPAMTGSPSVWPSSTFAGWSSESG